MTIRSGTQIRLALISIVATLSASLTFAQPAQAAPCVSPSHGVNGEGLGRMTGTYHLKVATLATLPHAA